MKLLLKNATIFDPGNQRHLISSDIVIQNGVIHSIKDRVSEDADEVFDCKGAHVSIGWVDAMADFGEPGYEYRETFESGARTAAAGGFTDVIMLPDATPPRDNAASIAFIKHRAESLPVNLHPLAALTEKLEGKKLAEMYDMHASGAVAFSDGLKPVQSAAVMMQALDYLQAVEGLIVQIPFDKDIAGAGLMNESKLSSLLGLPGIPAIAEELVTKRDLELLRYSGSRLHIAGVSTAKNLEQIKNAKAEGLRLTCSVQAAHLLFTEESLSDYNTVYKITPPLRSKEDMTALRKGLEDGIIDAVFSHHLPRNTDEKISEFQTASEGMAMMQYMAAALFASGLSEEVVVRGLTAGRDIFNLGEKTKMTERTTASLTIYIPDESFSVSSENHRSLSANHPFADKRLQGKVIAIVNKGKLFRQ